MEISYAPLGCILAASKMSFAELGRKCRFAAGTRVALANDKPVSLDVLKRVCEALDCSIEEVVEIGNFVNNSQPHESQPFDILEDDQRLSIGDVVQHFKHEIKSGGCYYRIVNIAEHTETGERLVIYEALYPPYKIYARPYSMFMSEVDHDKYPDIHQKYRMEKMIF